MFKKAVKEEAKLRLAIAGPSGSGKTYTALAVGTALGKVALVDTEHGSASKYADIFDFDVAEMHAPFHPDKYAKAIEAATAAGYDVVILDSLSHAWNGPGGVLEIVEQASKKYRGNSYAGWQEGTPVHNRLIEAIVGAGIHVIGTMRSKQEYILIDKNGKQQPQKVGMAPVQRDGFEYEFDVFLDMDVDNNAIVSKTRCPALTGAVITKPGKPLAETLAAWLGGVKVERPTPPSRSVDAATGEITEGVIVEFDDIPSASNGAGETPAALPPADDAHKFYGGVLEAAPWYGTPEAVRETMAALGIAYPDTAPQARAARKQLVEHAQQEADKEAQGQ